MHRLFMTCVAAGVISLGLGACSGSSDHGHDHDHGAESHKDGHTEGHDEADHSKFGHLSAVYVCGDEEIELKTSHTDDATTLSYLGKTVKASRKVTVIDDAFTGETFDGKLNGQSFVFKGKGYDASMSIGGETISCEKISCIPLGGPH